MHGQKIRGTVAELDQKRIIEDTMEHMVKTNLASQGSMPRREL